MKLIFPYHDKPSGHLPVQINEDIYWYRLPLPMALDHVNVYAIEESRGWTVIDTGFYSDRGVDIWKKIISENFGGKPVKRVVVSHYHPDHVGMAGWFKRQFNADIYATRISWLFARMLTLDVHEKPTPEALNYVKASGVSKSRLDQIKQSRPFNFADCVHPIPLGFKRLQEGDWLKIGSRNWEVRIGSGHAPDHATFWSDDGKICIGADQFLPDITSNVGVYASEPDANPLGDWLNSCQRFLKMANEDILVLPGHKAPFRGLKTRLQELIDHHHGCLAVLTRELTKPTTAIDCFDSVFGRKIPDKEFGLALAETNAHLNFLLWQNKINRTQREGVNYWQNSG